MTVLNIIPKSARLPSLQCLMPKYAIALNKRWIFSSTGVWPKFLEKEDLHVIEQNWKAKVPQLVKNAESQLDNSAKSTYVLSMFPYPSGQLHMGHVRVYAISDAMAHYHRMMKRKVIHPMGWDAFGLPAENAAIERNIQPQKWTKSNIANMKAQLEDLRCLFDWDREFSTCDPSYYKWTQYLFLQMYKEGLVYQKEAMVNWDPIDQTVLANEQVDDKGRSWRSGALVEQKLLKQWFIRTTNYSKDLYDGLDDPSLQNWQDIVQIQKHWIGQCNGTNVDFVLDNCDDALTIWTDQPQYLNNVVYIGLPMDHMLNRSELVEKQINDKFNVLNIQAVHPLTNQKIPILVHRDSSIDDPYLGLPQVFDTHKLVAKETNIEYSNELQEMEQDQVMKQLRDKNLGGYWTSQKLKDWLISRQRYWGTPIPIIHCPNCGPVPVPESDLPVELPELETLSVKGKSPLLQAEDWINTTCPCPRGVPAKRETDTMDTFVDSSWYFARYLDPKNDKEPLSQEAAKDLPVDLYIGGKEHATLHMYFARFFTHFMHKIGLSPVKEPFQSLLVQGMVKGKSYRVKGTTKYLYPHEVDTSVKPPIEVKTGNIVVEEWEKMSKSKYNGVDPSDILKEFGSDTTKLLILSDVSPQSDRKWNPKDSYVRIENMQRKLWKLVHQVLEFQKTDMSKIELSKEDFKSQEAKCWDARNYYLRGANHAYRETKNFAMVQARVQGLLGDLWTVHGLVKRDSPEFHRALGTAIVLLTPMAPHFCAELWNGLAQALASKDSDQDLDWSQSVFHQTWPELDSNYNLKIVINRNGKSISEVPIALWKFKTLEAEEAYNIAYCDEKVQELVLSSEFQQKFSKLEDFEAVIDFSVKEAPLSAEEKQRLKDEAKEAKKLKKAKREAKKAKIEADLAAKKARNKDQS